MMTVNVAGAWRARVVGACNANGGTPTSTSAPSSPQLPPYAAAPPGIRGDTAMATAAARLACATSASVCWLLCLAATYAAAAAAVVSVLLVRATVARRSAWPKLARSCICDQPHKAPPVMKQRCYLCPVKLCRMLPAVCSPRCVFPCRPAPHLLRAGVVRQVRASICNESKAAMLYRVLPTPPHPTFLPMHATPCARSCRRPARQPCR